MTCQEQEDLWVAGTSVHNGASRKEGECCPDFSCCNPGMKWSEEKRRAFADADETTRHKMMGSALKDLMDYHEMRKVHIVTDK